MDIKAFAEKFIGAEDEAWIRGNFAPLEALETPDVVYHMPAPYGDMAGFQGHKQFIEQNRQGITEHRQDWGYLTGDGSVFALSYKSSAKRLVDNPMMPGTAGKRMVSDGLFVFRVEHGRVAEAWFNGTTKIE